MGRRRSKRETCGSLVLSIVVVAALFAINYYLPFECSRSSVFAKWWEIPKAEGNKSTSRYFEILPSASFGQDKVPFSLGYVDRLLKAWETLYGLNTVDPPKALASAHEGEIFPFAPHLEDCFRLTEYRQSLQERTIESLPEWADSLLARQDFQPPWISGPADGNLKLTRFAQTLIWKNQFPADCKSRNVTFTLLRWTPLHEHNMGASLHSLRQKFIISFSEGRVLVPLPGSIEGEESEACKVGLSFHCFFFPPTSRECEEVALLQWKRNQTEKVKFVDATIPEPLLTADIHSNEVLEPWRHASLISELNGEIGALNETFGKVNFWRTQVIRFLLRFPSNRMCHETNKMRHLAFGREAAERIVQMERNQAAAMALVTDPQELEALRNKLRSFTNRRWQDPPFIPHPIVSIYVGEKSARKGLVSLAANMLLAEKLKAHIPDMTNVWLSTEMESVVEESKKMSWWKFYYSNDKRQRGDKKMHKYTHKVGPARLAFLSFANLLISAECDCFVDALSSNWAQLINELGLTNGKLGNSCPRILASARALRLV